MEEELKQIVEKVRNLYKKYGIKSVTMDDVARELGISKKTLYQYVQNKDEMVEKVVELYELEHEEYFKKMQSKKLNAIQSLLWVNQLTLKMLKEHNPSMQYDLKKYHPEVFYKVSKRNQEKIYQSVLNNIKQGKDEGLYRENIDEEIIAKLYVLRIDSLTNLEIFKREEMMDAKFADQMLEYHIRGMASEKGIKEYIESKKSFINENNTQ